MRSSYIPGFIILGFGILGLLIAAVQQIAYDNEYVLHLYVEASEVPGLQVVTIVVFLLAGGILAALSS